MAQAAQQDPLKVQRFCTCVKEALAVLSCKPRAC